MFQITKKEINWGGRTLTLETGRVARQADGAVLATYGQTTVLATVVASKTPSHFDFFPLTVNYQEKFYAAGRIPGGFLKREGRPSEVETLTCRLIDRPIRPLFPAEFRNETQVICTVLSYDQENDPDIVALVATSAALAISGIPFLGPIGAARVGYDANGSYILNPTVEQLKESRLELVVAGTKEGVLMVESEAHELSEEVMLKAVLFGHESFQPVIKMINDMAKDAGKPTRELPGKDDGAQFVDQAVDKTARAGFEAAYKITEKQLRVAALKDVRTQVTEKVTEEFAKKYGAETHLNPHWIQHALSHVEEDVMRSELFKTRRRIDGREPQTVRPILAETKFLPRVHGSALFTRGETQAIVVATLGTGEDEVMIDGLDGVYKENFMLHYNFPPFSVGEVGRTGSPGRREVGHGKLAWRALHPVLPSKEVFPYTLRIVSDITESNGSSSMATVCGGSLSLMDAGVPLKAPVAGIAMGLLKEKDDFIVLTDILGDEDHLGDMDFKVAGTADGITALQMDIKITSITGEIMKEALAHAKQARLHILGEMAKDLSAPREISPNAPATHAFKIDKEKIREVIGSGGKVIREICETTGAKIDIEDDGSIRIFGPDTDSVKKAVEWVQGIVAVPEVGKIYSGKVTSILEFGAFVNFMGKQEGLVHVSQIAKERVNDVNDHLKVGDVVKVKLIGIDERGRVKLSIKDASDEAAN